MVADSRRTCLLYGSRGIRFANGDVLDRWSADSSMFETARAVPANADNPCVFGDGDTGGWCGSTAKAIKYVLGI